MAAQPIEINPVSEVGPDKRTDRGTDDVPDVPWIDAQQILDSE